MQAGARRVLLLDDQTKGGADPARRYSGASVEPCRHGENTAAALVRAESLDARVVADPNMHPEQSSVLTSAATTVTALGEKRHVIGHQRRCALREMGNRAFAVDHFERQPEYRGGGRVRTPWRLGLLCALASWTSSR
ncbi:hypothetical protein ONR57_03175 [Hoyosella sp. YIM 151337]|nr:hypothetical protein [Hoyosella sp. YIM 151337]MCW4352297.1 hypothetical protein [Hoyosella sp. YIM 151337]